MAGLDKYVLSRLFIAIPELQIDKAFLTLLHREGLASDEDLAIAENVRAKNKRYGELAGHMRGKSVIERIILIVPEILTASTIDLLRKWDLISATQGNALRVGLKGGKAGFEKVSQKTALERWAALGKSVISFDTINLLRNLDEARINRLHSGLPLTEEAKAALDADLATSVLRGQRLRSVLSTGRLSLDTLAAINKADGLWGILTVVGEGLLSDRLLKDAIRAGVISQSRYELISALNKLGLNIWKKGVKAIEFDSIEARMMLMSEGILSVEMINALLAAGIIPPELAKLLYPAARGIRAITRSRLAEHMKSIRVRVIPGEPPIKTISRIGQITDRELLKLLAEASKEARRTAEALTRSEGFGKLTRAAQQRLIAAELNKQMRIVWEGVGHLTIFGEKESARAAAASMDFLQDNLWNGSSKEARDFRRMIERETENGVDAYISRQENIREFSKRIYKNNALSSELLGRRINIGLLRGLNAKELALDVASLINPGVSGGISYNAMRLSRTEINNAFHNNAIRSTREMPWISGYRWNLSGSHPHVDICNSMAQGNHDGIGRGVYKKANVPQKPHPQCFCYITSVTDSPGEWERKFKNGSYDSYLKSTAKNGVYPEVGTWHDAYNEQARNLVEYATSALAGAAIKSFAPQLILDILNS